MSDFHFIRPLWFLALIPSILILAILWLEQARSSSWHTVFDRHLLAPLWLEKPGKYSRTPIILLGTIWLLVILALAGPTWERLPEPIWRSVTSRILILDLSTSMAATDLAPSRLERARFKVEDILKRSTDSRTGMVVFAGEPHIVTPLTEDTATISNLLSALNTDIIPEPGNSGAPALKLAISLLQQAGLHYGDVLLLSDGLDDISATLEVARDLKTHGYRLSVLALGTSHLDIDALQEVARTGGGTFSPLTANDHDLDHVLLESTQASHMEERMDSGITRWVEHGVWLLPLLLVLAAAGFRRGWLSSVLVILLLPPPVQALEWRDLWLRQDQQAAEKLMQGQPNVAARQFSDPAWRGIALYQAGDYTSAAQAFAQSNDVNADYNRGNALAKAGELNQAAQAYRDVLRQVPQHADAKINLALIEELMQQQEQPADSTQEEDNSQQPSQSGDDEMRQTQENNEANTDSNTTTENSEPAQNQDKNEPNGESETESSLQDENNKQDLQSGQKHEDTMESAYRDVKDQVQQQDKHHDEQDLSNPSVNEIDESFPVEKFYDETELALDQWLRQIPEDPSGLLRRKFMLEHMRRKQELK